MVSKHLIQDYLFGGKYSNKLITAQNSEIYTNFMPGLLHGNEIFCSVATLLTPEHTVHYQHMLGFTKFAIKMQLRLKNEGRTKF